MDKSFPGGKKATRKTVQKQMVLQVLKEAGRHLTADEVYEIVRKRVPHISLGTVYRNLEMLAETGQASKIDLGEGKRRFDPRTDRHYHFRCIRCGRIYDLLYFPIEDLKSVPMRSFHITGVQVVLEGVCEACLQKEKEGGTKMSSIEMDETQKGVLQALSRFSKPVGNKEIAREAGVDAKTVAEAIRVLKARGWVDSPVRYKYTVTDSGKTEVNG